MLRRFARALCGTQDSGDSYVAAMLETLVEGGVSIAPDDVRRGLYGALIQVWRTVPINAEVETEHDLDDDMIEAADRSLARLMPDSRVAFLLNALEGFTTDDLAVILDIPAEEASALQEEAAQEIAGMMATRVLIIEDEPMIALDLEMLVTDLGHDVTGVARTRTQAVAAIQKDKPGLVLADIQLADGSSGLDAVHDILREVNVPVIFITAFPERLLTGTRPEPTFLITKPFRPHVVKAIIAQALFFDRKAGTAVLTEAR